MSNDNLHSRPEINFLWQVRALSARHAIQQKPADTFSFKKEVLLQKLIGPLNSEFHGAVQAKYRDI